MAAFSNLKINERSNLEKGQSYDTLTKTENK